MKTFSRLFFTGVSSVLILIILIGSSSPNRNAIAAIQPAADAAVDDDPTVMSNSLDGGDIGATDLGSGRSLSSTVECPCTYESFAGRVIDELERSVRFFNNEQIDLDELSVSARGPGYLAFLGWNDVCRADSFSPVYVPQVGFLSSDNKDQCVADLQKLEDEAEFLVDKTYLEPCKAQPFTEPEVLEIERCPCWGSDALAAYELVSASTTLDVIVIRRRNVNIDSAELRTNQNTSANKWNFRIAKRINSFTDSLCSFSGGGFESFLNLPITENEAKRCINDVMGLQGYQQFQDVCDLYLQRDPDAQDDIASTTIGQPVSIPILDNDSDPNGDTVTVIGVSDGSNGLVVLDSATGVVTYTPNDGFVGNDSFDYTIEDATGRAAVATVDVTVMANTGQAAGDPHFNTWHGEKYDFHGKCDLELLSDPDFANGKGLKVHIRTEIVRQWSYIKNAAIQIGSDILEVQGGGAEQQYWINKEFQGELTTIGGFQVSHKQANSHSQNYAIHVGKAKDDVIEISTYKDFVRVDFKNPTKEVYGNSVGMLGDFVTGKKVGRDGITDFMDSYDDFGQEWQVLPIAPTLFHSVEAPQAPSNLCVLPSELNAAEKQRRLGEQSITKFEAEVACHSSGISGSDHDMCVDDVMAADDLDMAGIYKDMYDLINVAGSH